MKKLLISTIVISMLAGCVVTPYHPYMVQPAVVVQPGEIVYPQVESAYIWDAALLSFFFMYGGQRHYMNRGWGYHSHGVPHGHYHR